MDDPRDRFHETSRLSNPALARLVEDSRIDLLVDLNGYSKPPRLGLFAVRPAPVQVAWFNMFATSGSAEFDYLVGDAHVLPAGEEHFCTEEVVRLPGCYLTFEVGYPVPEVTPPPCTRRGYLTFGCLSPQYKITTQVVETWSRILEASPGSRLILKNTILEKPAARDFVRDLFARFSIPAERLELDGPAEHFTFLQRYADIDLALDTFPYNGGTTTMEALWQGVPVLTFVGDRWVSRISASLLHEAGLPEFVAPDLDHHVRQAIDLARIPDPRPPRRSAGLDARSPPRLVGLRRPGFRAEHGKRLSHDVAELDRPDGPVRGGSLTLGDFRLLNAMTCQSRGECRSSLQGLPPRPKPCALRQGRLP